MAQTYRAAMLVGRREVLNGPTGEENELQFVALGLVAGVAPDRSARLHQVLAAMAGGNAIALDDDAITVEIVQRVPATVAAMIRPRRDWWALPIAALLFEGDDATARAWRVRLADRGGPIVPLLRAQRVYDPMRLVRERAVSVNTAAAGGNAFLMTLDE